jgi:hypothetical protein
VLLENYAYLQAHLLNYHALQDINALHRGYKLNAPLAIIVESTLQLALNVQLVITALNQLANLFNAQ